MDYQQLILAPVSEENVCGISLEDEADFQNFFFVAQGTPERFDGVNTLAAEPPDWRAIKKQALDYLAQSKDIKLISILAQAVLNTEGMEKFSECLQGLSQLIDTQWQSVYPPLDEDDGDPLERVSALAHLNESFIYSTLKNLPLASVRGAGSVSLAYLDNAENDQQLSESQIKGIFQEKNRDELQLFYHAVRYSHTSLTNMSVSFTENAGHEYALDFDKTMLVLERMSKAIEQYSDVAAAAEAVDSEAESAVENNDMTESGESSVVAGHMAKGSFHSGEIHSREDVERCLQAVIEYYAKYESTSPLPILINRALKLVNKDFLGVMKDIYPDALPALYHLGGITEGSEETSGEDSSDDGW